jgi:hypothetical protein
MNTPLSPEVETFVKDATTQLATALQAIKNAEARAIAAEAKVASLDAELAREKAVYLQKVASHTKFAFANEDVERTVGAMVEAGFCHPQFSKKLAMDLSSNPVMALSALERISTLSIENPRAGFGVKSASSDADNGDADAAQAEENEAARLVATQGA